MIDFPFIILAVVLRLLFFEKQNASELARYPFNESVWSRHSEIDLDGGMAL